MPTLYFDDPEEGLDRATSHPAFVQLAQDDFYFDGADDFSPFGSDDGFDTLAALEDWYREGAHQSATGMDFLQGLLAAWDFPIPADMLTQSDAAKTQWLAEGMNDSWLASVCKARVATAFGQIKISGQLDATVREQALLALDNQLFMNERGRRVHPDWEWAEHEANRLRAMHRALTQFQATH